MTDLPNEGRVYKSRYSNNGPLPGRCCADVGRGWSNEQCSRKTKVTREVVDWSGNQHTREYCGAHDPVAKAEKTAQKYAAWEAEAKLVAKRRAEEVALAKLKVEALNAIRLIADGHTDPRGLALSVLAQGIEAGTGETPQEASREGSALHHPTDGGLTDAK